MLAGTVIALGGIGAEAGLGNKRGSIVSGAPAPLAARLRLRRPLSAAGAAAAAAPAEAALPAGRRRASERALGALVRRPDRAEPRRDPDLRRGGAAMSLSMNERAAALVDAMVADADALGIEVRTLDSGARLVDCGAAGPRRTAGRPGLRGGLHGRPGPDRPAAGHGRRADVAGRRRRGRRSGRGLPGRAVRRLEARARRLLRDGQRAGPRAGPRRGPVRRAGLARAGRPRGPVPGDAAGAAARRSSTRWPSAAASRRPRSRS